jgi:hypothetical protein
MSITSGSPGKSVGGSFADLGSWETAAGAAAEPRNYARGIAGPDVFLNAFDEKATIGKRDRIIRFWRAGCRRNGSEQAC